MKRKFYRKLSVILAMGSFLFIWSLTVAHARIIEFTPEDSLEKIGRAVSKALPGTQVKLAPGDYLGSLRISSSKGISKNPIILMGSPGTRIKTWDSSRQNRDGYGEHGILVQNSSHLILKGIEIQGAERGITLGSSRNISVINCNIHDVRNYGIMNYKSMGTRIQGNHISKSLKEHGIYFSGQASLIRIQDNIIEDTHINGIHINGKISSILMERNQLLRIGTYPQKEGGAAVTMINGASDALIRNNVFSGVYGQGMTISGPGVRVVNNVFHDVAWSIILGLQGAETLSFYNNIILEKKAVPFQIVSGVLASFESDFNYYSLKNQPLYEKQGKKLNWNHWQKKGFDLHSVSGKSPFSGSIGSGGINKNSYVLDPGSPCVDTGFPGLEDAKIPPGIGMKRSDMGIYGGPGNGW